jgi:hypothetical protein
MQVMLLSQGRHDLKLVCNVGGLGCCASGRVGNSKALWSKLWCGVVLDLSLFVFGCSSTGASDLCHRQGVLLMAQTAFLSLNHTFIYIVLSVSPCFLILIAVIREDEFGFLSVC